MMRDKALSVNSVPIRLNAERWMHITIGHPEIADYYFNILQVLESPETVYAGTRNELLAVRKLEDGSDKSIIVVYKEVSVDDGFVITAYLSNKLNELQKRTAVWQRQN
jgi:hypothetical protein